MSYLKLPYEQFLFLNCHSILQTMFHRVVFGYLLTPPEKSVEGRLMNKAAFLHFWPKFCRSVLRSTLKIHQIWQKFAKKNEKNYIQLYSTDLPKPEIWCFLDTHESITNKWTTPTPLGNFPTMNFAMPTSSSNTITLLFFFAWHFWVRVVCNALDKVTISRNFIDDVPSHPLFRNKKFMLYEMT